MEGAMFWGLAAMAAFCVGLSKGGAPGFGSLAVPLLSLVLSPVAAAGLLLPVFVITDIFGVWAYRRHVNWTVIKVAVLGIVLGTGIGWATAHLVSDSAVRVLVGLIGLLFSLNYLIRKTYDRPAQPLNRQRGFIWTTIAGFTSFVSHSGAPPWQIWVLPQKLPKLVFAGTTAVGFAIMNVLKIVPYYMLGQLRVADIGTMALLLPAALLGVLAAYRLIRILPERLFYSVVTWMLLAISLKLIWDGLVV